MIRFKATEFTPSAFAPFAWAHRWVKFQVAIVKLAWLASEPTAVALFHCFVGQDVLRDWQKSQTSLQDSSSACHWFCYWISFIYNHCLLSGCLSCLEIETLRCWTGALWFSSWLKSSKTSQGFGWLCWRWILRLGWVLLLFLCFFSC